MAEVAEVATAAPTPESTTAPADPLPPPAKRRRLNFACNACRKKKVRCDEQQPSCRNCRAAGIPCITTDKRRPGVEIRRHEAGSQRSSSPPETVFSPGIIGNNFRRGTRPSQVPVDEEEGVAGEAQGEVHLSPDSHAEVRPDGTRRFSGRLPILSQSSARTSLGLLTDWLNIAFYRLGLQSRLAPAAFHSSIPPAVSSSRSTTVSHSTGAISISTNVPALPSLEVCEQLVDIYFRDVDSIFSLVDRRRILEDLETACAFGGPQRLIREGSLSALLRLYLVLSLGAINSPELDPTAELSHSTVNFCQTLLGHAMGWNTIEAVQIVFLLSLCLRCLDQISSSWSAISLCVSMAISLGINRRSVSPSTQPSDVVRGATSSAERERQRTWWCIYAWEKLHAFELGRASCIVDADCNQQELPNPCSDVATSVGHADTDPQPRSDPHVLISLARTLSDISQKCIQMRNKEERAITESAMAEKTQTTMGSYLKLVGWAEGLDVKYRLQTDLFTSARATPSAVFLALSYNNALIMLKRNIMLVNPAILQRFIDKLGGSKPWMQTLKTNNGVAVNAARRVIRLLVEVAEMDLHPPLPTLIGPLQAAYILMVQLINHPTSRTIHSDLALIQQAHGFALQHHARSSRDGRLKILLDKLNDFLRRHLQTACGATMVPGLFWPVITEATAVPQNNASDATSSPTLLDPSTFRGDHEEDNHHTTGLEGSEAPGSPTVLDTTASTEIGEPFIPGSRGQGSNHDATLPAIYNNAGTSVDPISGVERPPGEAPVPIGGVGTDMAGLDAPWWPGLVDDIGWDWTDLAQVI